LSSQFYPAPNHFGYGKPGAQLVEKARREAHAQFLKTRAKQFL
jgi:hypothetical protein